jgi:hypothetical protein
VLRADPQAASEEQIMANDTAGGSGNKRGNRNPRQHGGSGGMSVREAGRMGGQTRREQLGPAGYSELGKLGGEARKEQLGPAGYSRLGHLGGQRVRELVEKGKRAEDDAGHGDRSR